MGSIRLPEGYAREKGVKFNLKPVSLWLAEGGRQALRELFAREAVILRAARLDLDRAHERCNKSGGAPVAPVQEAVEQARAERIPGTGRIHHRVHGRCRNADLLAPGMDDGTCRPARYDERLDVLHDLAYAPAALLLQQLPLVVVHRHPARLPEETLQLLGPEHGQPLSRIEDEGNAGGGELRRVLEHALASIGGHDSEGDAVRLAHAIRVAVLHGAGVERRDLVVIEIGGDEGLRGELAFDHPHVPGGDPGALEPL